MVGGPAMHMLVQQQENGRKCHIEALIFWPDNANRIASIHKSLFTVVSTGTLI